MRLLVIRYPQTRLRTQDVINPQCTIKPQHVSRQRPLLQEEFYRVASATKLPPFPPHYCFLHLHSLHLFVIMPN